MFTPDATKSYTLTLKVVLKPQTSPKKEEKNANCRLLLT